MKHGVTLESDYPYTARTGTCQPDKIKPVANISGYCRLPHVADNFTAEMQYDQLMQAVTQVGPIAISASAEPWQLYERGVFSSVSGSICVHVFLVASRSLSLHASRSTLCAPRWMFY